MDRFDLIITSAETLVAPFPNVLNIGLPLMRVDPARLEQGRAAWQAALAPLPRPIVAFLIAALAEGQAGAVPRFDWHAPEGENPYAGLLALADRFVVTGDSISMQVEVARLGKPLEILALPTGGLGWL